MWVIFFILRDYFDQKNDKWINLISIPFLTLCSFRCKAEYAISKLEIAYQKKCGSCSKLPHNLTLDFSLKIFFTHKPRDQNKNLSINYSKFATCFRLSIRWADLYTLLYILANSGIYFRSHLRSISCNMTNNLIVIGQILFKLDGIYTLGWEFEISLWSCKEFVFWSYYFVFVIGMTPTLLGILLWLLWGA